MLGAPFQVVNSLPGQVVRRRAELEALGSRSVENVSTP